MRILASSSIGSAAGSCSSSLGRSTGNWKPRFALRGWRFPSTTCAPYDLTVKVAEGTYATTVDKGQMVIEVPKDEYKLSAKQIEELADESIQLSVMQCEIVINKLMIKLTAFGSSITMDATGIKVVGAPTVSMNMG